MENKDRIAKEQQAELWDEAAMIAGFILDMADNDREKAHALVDKIKFPAEPKTQRNREDYIRERIDDLCRYSQVP